MELIRPDRTRYGGEGGRGEQQMIPILAIDATQRALRAVVRDPTARLWIDLGYRDQPDARCLVDGRVVAELRPPGDPVEAVRLVARLVDARGITVGAVAHRLREGRRPSAELIHDDLPGELDSQTVAVVRAARARWPHVPHIACRAAGPDVGAEMDRLARQVLGPEAVEDDRARQMLADPRRYFARARERATREIADEVERRARRATH